MTDKALKALIKSGVEAMDCVFVGYETVAGPRRTILRIFIDTPEENVTIDQCAKVSKHLSGVLEVADAVSGKYNLEVSSPGIERPLFEIEDYGRFTGQTVKLRLHGAIEGQKNFTAEIVRVENDDITFTCEDKEMRVPFHTIKKANLVVDI